jgi:hypothetical protein
LAPLYDLMCTQWYGDDRLAMYVDDVHRTDRVTTDRIVNEAARWGMPHERAATIVNELVDAAPAAISAALDETSGVPDELISSIEGQLVQLRSGE